MKQVPFYNIKTHYSELTHKIPKQEQPGNKILVLVFRVGLGIIITLKGIIFLSNLTFLDSLLQHSTLHRSAESFWKWYIALANLLCGILIITGLFTRVAIILQLPILMGAVLFVNLREHAFHLNGELALSLVVLCMLFYFLLKGPGEISMDNYLRNHEP